MIASPSAAHSAASPARDVRTWTGPVRRRPRQEERGQHHDDGGHRDGQPLHADRDAEDPVEARDDPVAQDRLVEARLVVERGGDEVAAFQHLAGRFDVVRLVRVPDRRAPEIDEVRADRQHEQQHEPGGPGEH